MISKSSARWYPWERAKRTSSHRLGKDGAGLLQVSCVEPGQCVALGAPTATVLDHQTLVYGHSVPVYSSLTSRR